MATFTTAMMMMLLMDPNNYNDDDHDHDHDDDDDGDDHDHDDGAIDTIDHDDGSQQLTSLQFSKLCQFETTTDPPTDPVTYRSKVQSLTKCRATRIAKKMMILDLSDYNDDDTDDDDDGYQQL